MKVTEATTLAELSIILVGCGLSASAELTAGDDRFVVTLRDIDGVEMHAMAPTLVDAFAKAIRAYENRKGVLLT